MAIVSRRYAHVGPTTNALLAKYVDNGTPPTIGTQYSRVTVDINYDNTVAGLVDDLDTFMSGMGFVQSDGNPKQVFRYVAVGGEGASFTINAAKGFVARTTALYTVQFTLSRPGGNALKLVSIVEGSQTTTQFDIELSVAVEAGDVLQFTVEDR